MIQLVRVDDRLLHGQVLRAWVPFVKANLIIVVSDEAAGDDFRKAVMSASADEDLDVLVLRVDEVAEVLSDSKVEEVNVFLVLRDLSDAMRLYKTGVDFNTVNIGNVHYQGKEGIDAGRMITISVRLSAGDEKIIEEFIELGVGIDIRDLPTREATQYKRKSS